MSRRLQVASALGLALLGFSVQAATVVVQVTDSAGEGFNDPTPVAPVAGNTGTTLGQQRLNVFIAAGEYWGSRLDSSVPITVSASFDPLSCAPTSAVLGSAGPITGRLDFNGAPVNDVLYYAALANSLGNEDFEPGTADIVSRYNSTLDAGTSCLGGNGWDYRIGINTGSSLELYNVVLHELGHGLGFSSLVNANGSRPSDLNDQYTQFLRDNSTAKQWQDMTNAERAASYINAGNVVWTGPGAVAESTFLSAGLNNGRPRIFAPNPARSGSSIAHFDTAMFPNDIMEPSATAFNEDWLTLRAMYDMGWAGNPCLSTELPTDQWVMFSLDCEPPSGQNTLADLIGDDIAGAYLSTWGVYDFDESINDYRLVQPTDTLVVGQGYWVKQTTGAPVFLDVPAASARTPSPVATAAGCGPNASCFAQPLTATPDGQVNMVGNPYREDVNFDALRLVTDSGVCASGCSLATAAANDILAAIAFTWGADSTVYDTLVSGASDTLPARASAWFKTLPGADGLAPTLLFPR